MKKSSAYLMALTLTASVTGCSGLVESSRKLIDGETPRKNPKKSAWVSKSQYNDLMVKYKNLNEKYANLKDSKRVQSPNFDQASELGKPATETVDVFGKNGLANEVSNSLDSVSLNVPSTTSSSAPSIRPMSSNDIDQEVKTYKKAALLKANGKVEDSLKVFQFLEKTNTRQIRVRSRIHIGEIYLVKKQYDLALQVFETVIEQDAFSSRVIDALKGAVTASSKLGLANKKLRYDSMIKDIFGLKG